MRDELAAEWQQRAVSAFEAAQGLAAAEEGEEGEEGEAGGGGGATVDTLTVAEYQVALTLSLGLTLTLTLGQP